MNNNEKEYNQLEKDLEEDNESEDVCHDSLSPAVCDCCGKRLLMDEWEEFESMCEECTWENTSGILDDNPEEEM